MKMNQPKNALLATVVWAFCFVITGPIALRSGPLSGADDSSPLLASHRKVNRASSPALEKARVRNLRGMVVENKDAQSFGTLEDFLVDLNSGDVVYGLVASGGVLGVGKHVKLVPPQLLSAATAKQGVLALDVGRNRWQHAPRFKMADLQVVGLRAERQRIYGYYGLPQRRDSAQAATNSSALQTPAKNRPTSPAKPTAAVQLQFASSMLGKQLLDRQQQLIGEISDLLVDLKGRKPSLAIISANRLWNQHGSFAVSLPMLRRNDSDTWGIDANRKRFAEAHSLNEQSWEATDNKNTKIIYRYPNSELDEASRSASESLQTNVARLFPPVGTP